MESAQKKLPTNPYEHTNYISKLFFVWTLPFVRKGFKSVLNIDDIYKPLSSDQSESLGNRLES